ncbi:FAD-binding oxidoreductase [Micromonospora sp. HNM0581]|uniref:NAD(P)/FAD-dependent oxidoreductase n=1 Tax=Micromonospora sp. HNM0581 TaxID=2716341 RepID=UPI00146E167E|nr:FAD-binding oxidoreductase [Micromonospora sp. HNM0581]NLU80644.1 FAD-binding oxidoreductase [Micromonospora sp. HNM0581]
MSDGARDADVAVVGAGIIGCLVARRIVEGVPGTSVILIDRDGTGTGASRRSAGLHMPRGASIRIRDMATYSQDYYDKLRAEVHGLPIFDLGMTVVAPVAAADQLREAYLDTAAITPVERPNGIRVPDDFSAWTVNGAQYADVYGLVQAIARELRPRASIIEGVEVTGIDPYVGGVRLRLGTGETLRVGRVVLAPGPWLDSPAWHDLLAPAGIRVKRVVALHLEGPVESTDRAIVLEQEDAFLLPMIHRNHWLFSYTCQEWDVAPQSTDGLADRHLDQARQLLERYAPDFLRYRTSGRVFCDAYSPNREPVVRALTPDGRVVFAGAANGSGYRLAPAVARSAVDLLQR